LTLILPHYRAAFHELVRRKLSDWDVEYDLVYGMPHGDDAARADTVQVPWANEIRNSIIGFGGFKLIWQPFFREIFKYDLIIVTQENKLLINYLFQTLPRVTRPALAFWGHGRNFQSRKPQGAAERWKRFWATKCDWWFGYTEETKQHLLGLGFSEDKITVFNNSVDTAELEAIQTRITADRIARLRRELRMEGGNVAVFVGGLYHDKRLDFLIGAGDRIRALLSDFEMIIVGSGPELPKLHEAASQRPWLRIVGPKFGQEKVEIMMLAKLFLMPGLVGLAVLDAGILGLPVVTTNFPWHSPEIAYLESGVNGLIVNDWQDEAVYASAVVSLLRDPVRLSQVSLQAKSFAKRYTIEAMAQRFADGVRACLASE
jgi:glycosyltransferase involved in cell wall biosynthesis